MDSAGNVSIGNSTNYMRFSGGSFTFGGQGGGTQGIKFVQLLGEA